MQIIQQSGDALLEVVNDILDVSKIEEGKLTLSYGVFNLRTLLAEIIDVMMPRAVAQGIALRLELSEPLTDYHIGDALRIRQILLNLLTNAIKFTHVGHVVLSVRAAKRSATDNQLFFMVEDTGIGIAADKHDYIFHKFTQAEESTTRKYGGTGLGLAICKSLAEMMGGSIRLESSLGKGSRFYFDLPLAPGEAPLQGVVSSPSTDIAPLKSQRLLVVDDMPANRILLIAILKKLGYEVDAAVDGNDALSHIAEHDYALVFMDCHMPEMDGYSATRAIRAQEKKRVAGICRSLHSPRMP